MSNLSTRCSRVDYCPYKTRACSLIGLSETLQNFSTIPKIYCSLSLSPPQCFFIGKRLKTGESKKKEGKNEKSEELTLTSLLSSHRGLSFHLAPFLCPKMKKACSEEREQFKVFLSNLPRLFPLLTAANVQLHERQCGSQ